MMQLIFNWSQGGQVKEAYRSAQKPTTPGNLRDTCWMLDFLSFHLTPAGGDVFSYQFSLDGSNWTGAITGLSTEQDINLPDNAMGIRVTRTSGAGSSLGSVSSEKVVASSPQLLYAVDGVTDASGNFSYVFPTVLDAVPALSVDILSSNAGLTFSTVSKTVNGFTIQVKSPAIVTVLGINVLSGTFAAAAGIPISVLVAKK